MSIQPTMKQVESFTVTGFSLRTQNSDEFNEKTAKLPSLWRQFYTSELATNANIFGVYSNYDSDANGHYTVTVGVKSNHEQTQLSSVIIQAGNYLVFQGTGSMPATVVETWKQVWAFFETNTEHWRNFISDFESYSGSDINQQNDASKSVAKKVGMKLMKQTNFKNVLVDVFCLKREEAN